MRQGKENLQVHGFLSLAFVVDAAVSTLIKTKDISYWCYLLNVRSRIRFTSVVHEGSNGPADR